jgi:hypothetical protein
LDWSCLRRSCIKTSDAALDQGEPPPHLS